MKLAAAGLALAPLLVVQGRRVRRIALRLPEAAGPREGAAGRSPERAARTLRLLVVGDSSAAGVGAPTQDDALAGNLARALLGANPESAAGPAPPVAPDRVEWSLAARTGANAAEALGMIEALAPRGCDLAVVAVGVNDVTGATPPARWLRVVERLASTLQHRHGAACVIVSGLPPMHRFPLLPQPLRWYLGARARHLDEALARRCAGQPAMRHLPLPALADRSLMAEDGFHPSPAGYRVWAGALAAEAARALPSLMAGRPAAAASASTK
ncbi:SGNH/GDSL hydrolase family protein [Burkholderiaceae bacterium FT117]|uniref:SGNH/GDSL hydrolase family protein n=1 Tax=Zeimonas sediminis TaxID=2944268 RepID=UPI002342BFCD|nr:SGNH/GDSL hydrolase family protein [Zeimonas sediminis]MCM5570129.1 SGNH/GDSL hydrolase family protein [Zeimonas sediminis]